VSGGDKEVVSENYYVDIDALLDTRLGVIALKDPDLAAKALANNYWGRKQDIFPDISQEEFKQLWKNRTTDVLPLSARTNVLSFIQAIAKDKLVSQAVSNMESATSLVVNIYPYELTEEECDLIVAVLVDKTISTVNVSIVNLPDELLTPKYCKDNYVMMIRYDWMGWLEMHQKAFQEVKMPSVTIVAPCIYDKLPTAEDIEESKKIGLDFFRAAEQLTAPLFSLRFLDIEVFSVDKLFKSFKTA
jgi:hypothetical protein